MAVADAGRAALSALLLTLAFRFSSLSFLAFVFLLPLLAVKGGRKRAFFSFCLSGWLHYILSLWWVSGVSWLGLFLLAAYFALFWGLLGYLSRRIIPAGSLWGLGFLWVVLEYMRSYLILGGFPCLLTAYTQYRNLPFIQAADVLGAEFISFIVIMVNMLIFSLWQALRRRQKPAFFPCALVVLILLSNLGYGLFRLRQKFPAQGYLDMTVIQPNLKNNAAGYNLRLQGLQRLKELLKQAPSRNLAVLPEAAFPFIVEGRYIPSLFSLGRDMIVGALRREGENVYNSLFLFSAAAGKAEVYDKNHLVPFGEYVPARRFLHFVSALNTIDNMKAGKEAKILNYGKARIGPLICFEDIFPSFVAAQARRGANVFVNITDESWFRGQSEMIQHLQAAVFRAVEQRRALVRSANTGISCVITPWGVIKNFALRCRCVNTESVFPARIFLYSFPTLYSKIGNLFVWLSFLAVFLNAAVRRKRRGLWR